MTTDRTVSSARPRSQPLCTHVAARGQLRSELSQQRPAWLTSQQTCLQLCRLSRSIHSYPSRQETKKARPFRRAENIKSRHSLSQDQFWCAEFNFSLFIAAIALFKSAKMQALPLKSFGFKDRFVSRFETSHPLMISISYICSFVVPSHCQRCSSTFQIRHA